MANLIICKEAAFPELILVRLVPSGKQPTVYEVGREARELVEDLLGDGPNYQRIQGSRLGRAQGRAASAKTEMEFGKRACRPRPVPYSSTSHQQNVIDRTP